MESLALEAYRSRLLTAAQLRRLLVFETRMQVDAFPKDHEIYDYSVADLEQDRETLREIRMRKGLRWSCSRLRPPDVEGIPLQIPNRFD